MRFGLVVEYDGTEFHGSQLQANARTVQGEIEDALRKIFNENIRMYLASRTDSGVHARGQVGRFDEETNLTLDKITTCQKTCALGVCNLSRMDPMGSILVVTRLHVPTCTRSTMPDRNLHLIVTL